jgi:hypothetical protein
MMFSITILSSMLSFASPQELLQSAQTQLNAQQWEDAAATLDELITIIKEPAAEINYDRGIAHYNLEQYNQAAEAFEEAMSSADDPLLASFCAYNFGNAVYQSTMRDLEGTTNEMNQEEAIIALEDAKTQLKKTIDSYRRAIAKNTDDMDPRANGELAWKMLQQLDAMQEQMEQQQQQQQDDQNQEQQQDEESAKEQADNQQNKEQGDSDKEKQGEQQDGEQSDSKDPQSSEDQVGEKPKDKQKSDATQPSDKQEEGEQPQQKQDGEESESQDQQSSEDQQGEQSQQQQDTEQSQQQMEEKQNGSEDTPSEQETPNFEEGDLESTNEEGNNEPVESMDMKEEGERLSKSEASRLLQLIRDKEQQRRKLLAARKAARRVPVHKDW